MWLMSVYMNSKWTLDGRTWETEKGVKSAARKHAKTHQSEQGLLRYHIFSPCAGNGSMGNPKIYNGYWMMKWDKEYKP